jgi:hypothetical protein
MNFVHFRHHFVPTQKHPRDKKDEILLEGFSSPFCPLHGPAELERISSIFVTISSLAWGWPETKECGA